MAPRTPMRPYDEASWNTIPSRPGRSAAPPSRDPPPSTVQLFPWWERPLPGSQDFFVKLNSVALGAGPATTIKPATLITNLQPGYVAVIRFVQIFVDAPTTTLDVDWILLINDGPVPGWDRLGSFPRNATNLSLTFDGVVRVSQSATISIAIRNNEATARTVGAAYGGWQTPQGLIDQTFGAGAGG